MCMQTMRLLLYIYIYIYDISSDQGHDSTVTGYRDTLAVVLTSRCPSAHGHINDAHDTHTHTQMERDAESSLRVPIEYSRRSIINSAYKSNSA